MSVELDVKVATEIMGYHDNWDNPEADGVWEPVHIWNKVGILPRCPMYSSDMNAALDVIDELNTRGTYVILSQVNNIMTGKWTYMATVEKGPMMWHSIMDDNPAKAICLAALEFLERFKSGAV